MHERSAESCGCDSGAVWSDNDGVHHGWVCERHVAAAKTSGAQGTVATPTRGSAEWRKQRPLWSGVLKYFPDALLEVAHVSWVGNEQHNPGTPLHWDRSKSTDEGDAAARHLAAAGTLDSDGTRHSAKAAWRALALLQKELEAERGS